TFRLSALGGFSNGATYTAPRDLMHWWPGDGNANDVIGGQNGAFMGGATADAPGVEGTAFRFSGPGWVQVPNHPSFTFANSDAFPVEMWLYRASGQAGMHAIGKRADNFNDHSQLSYDPPDGLSFNHNGGTGAPSHIQPPINVWFHVVGTYDNQHW